MEIKNQNVILESVISDRACFIDYMNRFYSLFNETPNCIKISYYNKKKLEKWKEEEEILEELLKHKLTFNNKVLVYVISWVLANGFYWSLKNY